MFHFFLSIMFFDLWNYLSLDLAKLSVFAFLANSISYHKDIIYQYPLSILRVNYISKQKVSDNALRRSQEKNYIY